MHAQTNTHTDNCMTVADARAHTHTHTHTEHTHSTAGFTAYSTHFQSRVVIIGKLKYTTLSLFAEFSGQKTPMALD